MSMLQKILRDMYVEPELLDELDEEQKQILFCKMREEQLRRWAEMEKEWEEENERKGQPLDSKRRNVRWLIGTDGQPWVWVMGEHLNDKSIDQIIEEESMDRAKQLAEEEAEELRRQKEEELKDKLRMDSLDADEGSDSEEQTDPAVANLFASLRDAKLTLKRQKDDDPFPAPTQQLNSNKEKLELELRLREEAERRIDEEKKKRESEIYQSLKEAREKANVEAEKEAQEESRYWVEQERKARIAEDQIRRIARRAREEHRKHGLRTLDTTQNPPIWRSGRPEKPKSRSAIIDWFVREELARGTGVDRKTGLIAPWFHGIISRERAQELLRNKDFGSFLIRVSERIWGYALSFAKSRTEVKHFLIERVPEGYQFLGSNQIVHKQLWDLVSYHESVPVTPSGREVLREAVGQTNSVPDYSELFTLPATISLKL